HPAGQRGLGRRQHLDRIARVRDREDERVGAGGGRQAVAAVHEDEHVEGLGRAGGQHVAARRRAAHAGHDDEARARGRWRWGAGELERPATLAGELGEHTARVVAVQRLERATIVELHRSVTVSVTASSAAGPASGQVSKSASPWYRRSNPASETDTVSTGAQASSAAGCHASRASSPSHSSTSVTAVAVARRPALPREGWPGTVRYRPGASPALSARFHCTAHRPASAPDGAASR